jgi:hypothetical protein
MNLPVHTLRSARSRLPVLAGTFFAFFICTAPLPGQDDASGKAGQPATDPGAVEVVFTDNSTLKVSLQEQRLEVITAYGKLQIPIADIRRVEFRTRIPEDTAKKVEAAIASLGSPEFRQREEASSILLKLREKGYPALLVATRSKDLEVVRRAEEILAKIRDDVPEELLEFRKFDVVHTDDSKIAGQIDVSVLKANTFQFGMVQLKLTDMRCLRSMGDVAEVDAGNAAPDPGHLVNLRDQVGKKFSFRVTGAVGGSVWGTDFYTLDSSLATAAVHAGILKPGQSGIVRVQMLGPQPGFQGTNRNGIASASYGGYPGAYKIVK